MEPRLSIPSRSTRISLAWLQEMVETYGLADEAKALRILVDYAMSDGDRDLIFDEIRCHHC